MNMEAQALANVRERRKRRTQSAIFDGSEKKQTHKVETTIKNLDNQIDLTLLQEEKREDQYTEIDDELDILEAYIDPFDVKAQLKKARLIDEIDSEKQKIKCKFLFKYGRQESDPFKLWS